MDKKRIEYRQKEKKARKRKVSLAISFTQAHLETVCKELQSGLTISQIFKKHLELPGIDTFYRYLSQNKPASEAYARAKMDSLNKIANEIIEIADEALEMRGDGADNARVQAQRLRIESRKWLLSKLMPKTYGDYLQHGGDVNNPISFNFTVSKQYTPALSQAQSNGSIIDVSSQPILIEGEGCGGGGIEGPGEAVDPPNLKKG